jgi:hypothetical protein
MSCCGGGSNKVGIGTVVRHRVVYMLVPLDDPGRPFNPAAARYATEAEAMSAAPSGYVARAVVVE